MVELPRRPRLIIDNPSDLITDFMELTESDDTPDLYRRWCAIALVAGALERRVWAAVGNSGGKSRLTYPNLYTLLVGPPGVGKYIVETIRDLWLETSDPTSNKPAFKVAPTNMTKAALMDRLVKSTQSKLPSSGPVIEYNSLLVAAEEFGNFITSYDNEFIGVLNAIYNNPPSHSEERRYGPHREVLIPYPQLNILGAVQPGWLASIFPEVAWKTGLTSRMIMIYASEGSKHDLFQVDHTHPALRTRILTRLSYLSQLYGELQWTDEARHRINSWHQEDGPPTPTHSKLEHYCRRRTLHAIKIAITSTISRTSKVSTIDLLDVNRAIDWLVEAEAVMPDVFRAMVGRSDRDVIEELYLHLVGLWKTAGQSPIHEGRLFGFLAGRVPSDRVHKLLEVAERSNVLARMAGTDTYIPRARHEFSVE